MNISSCTIISSNNNEYILSGTQGVPSCSLNMEKQAAYNYTPSKFYTGQFTQTMASWCQSYSMNIVAAYLQLSIVGLHKNLDPCLENIIWGGFRLTKLGKCRLYCFQKHFWKHFCDVVQ